MKELFEYGLSEVGSWSLSSNHKSTKHLSHLKSINFNIKDKQISTRCNVVYAFVSNDAILYIGETTAGLKSRFEGYRYGNPLESDTDNRVKIEITERLEKNEKITIWYTMPVGTMQLPSGEKLELPMSKPFEELLISTLKPVLNLKKMHK